MRSLIFLFLAAPVIPASIALAQQKAPEPAAFTQSPQLLMKAFEGADHGTHPVTVLLEDAHYEFDEQGRSTYRHHLIFKVWTKDGADGWGMIQRNWAPWLEQKPEVRARVISPDGAVHELDPKTIAESAIEAGNDSTLSDRRMVRAPLPALAEGSVVEQEVVVRETALTLDAGTVHYFYLGNSVPVQRTRVEIRIPESLPLRYKALLLPALKVNDEKVAGTRTLLFEHGPMKELEDSAPLLPPDEPRSPHIVFSTARNWNSVASGYAAIVNRQLSSFDARTVLPKFKAGATREEKILSIVEKLNREIRYTGIEFSEASIVPRKPAEVLERKYGDCKDKSTLAVGMLRSAGIPAHVALLVSSTGADIEPDLPGMDLFNHAIVYVPGSPDLWLDLTDQDLRLGVVSPANQGRLALIADAATQELKRTPELTSEQNRVVETREFHLAEIGRAKVTETSDTFGVFDREYRGEFGGVENQKLRDSLKNYVEFTYGEAKVVSITAGQRDDLKTPYRLRIELENAQRGSSDVAEAAVGIFPSQILNRLPKYLREEEKEDDKEGDKSERKPAKARAQDYYLTEPFTYEWRYVIHAPPGFRLRQLPDAQEEKLGPAVFTAKFTKEGESLLRGELRLVTPNRRFSAAEGTTLRKAAVEFSKRKAMLIYFDQIGETALAAGRVREALKEFGGLRKLHPNEAVHATQTARALLAAGGGASARAEAKQAVAMEPKSAQGFIQLAEILKSDLVGRSMAKGMELDGAAAAYRKALEIDPSDDKTRANLAILLEYNSLGYRYGAGARLAEAEAEYTKIKSKLAGLGIPQNYPVLLFRMGKAEALRDYLKTQPDSPVNRTLRVCAEALLSGSKAAVQTASELAGAAERQQTLTSSGQSLIAVREYQLAADLLEAGAAGSANPAGLMSLVQMLRKTTKCDDEKLTITKPSDALRVFVSRLMHIEQHEKDWAEPLSPLMGEPGGEATVKGFQRGMAQGRAKMLSSGLGMEVGYDLMQSSGQYVEEGNDEAGWVVRATFPGANAGAANLQTFYVTKEQGGYRLVSMGGAYAGIARLVLQLIEKGQLDQAKVWLDRVRQQLPAGSGDDPLAGSMFPRIWQTRQPAEAMPMRVAAALLMTDDKQSAAAAIPILEAATREGSVAGITAGLAEAYFAAGEYAKFLPVANRLLKDMPQSPTAFVLALRAAYAGAGKAAARSLLNEQVEHFKDDVAALRGAATTAMLFGDPDSAVAVERRIVGSGRATASDYNAIAWSELMAERVTSETLDTANKGMAIAGAEAGGLLHTVAAVDAELGRESEARAAILQRIKAMGSEEPDDDDWYIFGRIAEQYGLAMDAAAHYKRLGKPGNDLLIPSTSYGLAQRRLKAMEKGKQAAAQTN